VFPVRFASGPGRAERAALEIWLVDALRWHRHTQLPAYGQWLVSVRREVQRGLNNENVNRSMLQLDQHWEILMERTSVDLAALLPTLSPAQRDALFAVFEEKNQAFWEEYIQPEVTELRSQRIERLADNFERWLGRLSDEQIRLIKQTAEQFLPIAEEQLVARRRWQSRLKQLLKTQGSDSLTAALKQHFSSLAPFYSVRHEKIRAHNRQSFVRLVVDIAALMDAQQKTHLLAEIDDYRQMFSELAAQDPLPADDQCAAC